MKALLTRILLCTICVIFCITACTASADPLPETNDYYRNWYEIFLYSFSDSDGDGIGDLQGVINKLDYIEEMGYNGLWLMPIMPSPSYHKYDVRDYLSVDPQYGTVADLQALVQACHARNICLILDLSINHTSTLHPWFTAACDAIRAGNQNDPYVDYYHFQQKSGKGYTQLEGTDWYYEEQFSGGGMPDLNLDNPAVLAEIRSICDFWLNTCDADGFRLDAVTSYYSDDTGRNTAFLSSLKQMTTELKPGSYLVGECWAGLNTIAEYYQSGVDSFFLFPASQAEGWIAKTVRSKKGGTDFVKHLVKLNDAIQTGIIAPFLGNHDTGRAMGSLQGQSNLSNAKFGIGLVNMLGGAVYTYYGDEIGMIGSATDPDKRIGMYWQDDEITTPPPGTTKNEYAFPCVSEQLANPDSLLNYCKAVNHAKLACPAIARGNTEVIASEADYCVLKRTWQNESSYIAINFAKKDETQLTLPYTGLTVLSDLEMSSAVHASMNEVDHGTEITLPARGILILCE